MSVTYDEATGRLLALLQALDGSGLGDHLGEARALLARVDEVERQGADGVARAQRTRAELVAAVADRRMDLDQAVERLATLAPWLASGHAPDGGGLADAFAGPVVVELRARAVRSARADGFAVHDVLSARADAAVRRAVEAGGRLIDVRAVATALTQPKRSGTVMRGAVVEPAPHPWLTNPPVLPTLDFADVQGDGAKMAAWAEAASGHAEWLEMHRVAGLLHDVAGGSSTHYAGKTDEDVWYFVKRLPGVVHLAVVDALGWRPGLHASLRPAVERPSMRERITDKMEGWATPAQQRNAVRRLLSGR
ncbi:hypothetical protein ACQP2P_01445 [Dactylosporangium sp. CA-139114]|uniref:hypothetical protein n=1 Tax=Dactylosporangium sp. CA-139114 TaxID=3239931 RepID=UPI003D963071